MNTINLGKETVTKQPKPEPGEIWEYGGDKYLVLMNNKLIMFHFNKPIFSHYTHEFLALKGRKLSSGCTLTLR